MNRQDVVKTLMLMAVYDRRDVDESTVGAWIPMLSDITFDEARDAVLDWYADSRDWMMPADLRRHVADTRKDIAEQQRRQHELEQAEKARRREADPTCGNPECQCSHDQCWHGRLKEGEEHTVSFGNLNRVHAFTFHPTCPECEKWLPEEVTA